MLSPGTPLRSVTDNYCQNKLLYNFNIRPDEWLSVSPTSKVFESCHQWLRFESHMHRPLVLACTPKKLKGKKRLNDLSYIELLDLKVLHLDTKYDTIWTHPVHSNEIDPARKKPELNNLFARSRHRSSQQCLFIVCILRAGVSKLMDSHITVLGQPRDVEPEVFNVGKAVPWTATLPEGVGPCQEPF